MSKLQLALEKPTIGYWSGMAGLEVKEILYGIEDKIECISGSWSGKPKRHLVKVYYGRDGRDYIRLNGYKFYLDECLRA